LEDFIHKSDSQDLLFSLVHYHHFRSWLVSVSKCIAVFQSWFYGRVQISSYLGLQRDDNITQSILEDEKEVAQTVSEIVASGDVNVYELRGDDADSFLNLLQEVRKQSFLSSVILRV
jgi:hypothetical protein